MYAMGIRRIITPRLTPSEPTCARLVIRIEPCLRYPCAGIRLGAGRQLSLRTALLPPTQKLLHIIRSPFLRIRIDKQGTGSPDVLREKLEIAAGFADTIKEISQSQDDFRPVLGA